MKIYLLTLVLISILALNPVFAQLSGDYFIDQTASGASLYENGGTYFTSFGDALDALWADGVDGPVVVHVTGGQTFNENLQIDSTFTGASALNTIEFKYEGSNKPVIQPLVAGLSPLVGVIDVRFNGEYHLTFNGLKINATNGSLTYRRGARVIWGADNVTIKNCEIVDFGANGVAIYFGGGSGGANDGCENVVVEGNNIYHENLSSTTFEVTGIWVNGGVNTQIRGNQVHDMLQGSGTLTGIRSIGDADTSDITIYNNFVTIANSVSSDIRIYGIYTQHVSGTTVGVYHNSVRLGGTVASASDYTAAMRFQNEGTTEVKDNIISNFRTKSAGSGNNYSIFLVNSNVTYNGDYNDFYTSESILAYRAGTIADLSEWQNDTGEDANSISEDPLFETASDLHIQESSLTADAGVRIPGIAVDIDGELRDYFNPDIGADEFSGDTSLPVGLSSFTAAVSDNTILLEWVTESEVNNLGFEIWRAEGEQGDYHLLTSFRDNSDLEGQGNSPVRHIYHLYDSMVSNGTKYSYKLADVDYAGKKTFHDPVSIEVVNFETDDTYTKNQELPNQFQLQQNYPNPFNPSTKITFTLPKSEQVILDVYNAVGQKVTTLINKKTNAGSHVVPFNASDLPSGTYFYRIQVADAAGRTGEFSQVRKMVLLR